MRGAQYPCWLLAGVPPPKPPPNEAACSTTGIMGPRTRIATARCRARQHPGRRPHPYMSPVAGEERRTTLLSPRSGPARTPRLSEASSCTASILGPGDYRSYHRRGVGESTARPPVLRGGYLAPAAPPDTVRSKGTCLSSTSIDEGLWRRRVSLPALDRCSVAHDFYQDSYRLGDPGPTANRSPAPLICRSARERWL